MALARAAFSSSKVSLRSIATAGLLPVMDQLLLVAAHGCFCVAATFATNAVALGSSDR
jgi:hypothetical protein